MSRLGHVARRPDAWATAHDRAKSRAAEQLDGPLEPDEAAWLEDHLAGCESCLATAHAYEEDRLALRSLREMAPEPPRDLWARTSAAIEQEAAGHRRASTGPARQSPLAQWGAIAGIAVVAVVVGSSVMSGSWLGSSGSGTAGVQGSVTALVTAPPRATGSAAAPGATPIAVEAGDVGWFDVGTDGSHAYNVANVDQVCAQVDQSSCAALDDRGRRQVALSESPKSIITSPANRQAIVVGADGAAGNSVFVLALPDGPEASPSPTATPPVIPSLTPTPPPAPSASAGPSAAPASQPPSPTPTPAVTPIPTMTPEPTAAALAIVSGVTVVGDAAAFSPDGAWFAFTARPADGSAGPDIYVWRVGEDHAHAMTSDHRSAFASWADGLVIGSRPAIAAPVDGASAEPTADASQAVAMAPVTFAIDPATGTESPLAFDGWRPAVAPTGDRAVAWRGSVVVSDDGRTITPSDGHLVLVPWSGNAAPMDPAAPAISDGPIADFTVRWDETGTWLAVWLADAADPSIGRLSLLHLDPATGTVDRPGAGPQDVPALPGFSIENGRLAWATPPSQDGEGSRVQIVAWSADGVGSIESAPGQEVVVVR